MKFLKNITHKFQGMSNRKKTVVSIASIIVLASAFLMCNAFFNKNSVLDEVRLKNSSDDTSMFAIMLEQSDGTYKESSDKTWPTGGTYVYDQDKSGCIDANGNTLNGILSYDSANNKAVVKTKQAAYCYLYFSFPLPDVTVEDVDLTKLNSAGYQKTMDCGTTGTATYNTKYQRIEFDSITAPAKCKFNYTEDTTNYPTLKSEVESKATEIADVNIIEDNSTFTPNETLSESSYTISNMETTSDSKNAFVWDSTSQTWTSQNHTASTTTNGGKGMEFTVPAGAYQLCYTMSSEKNYDYGTVYIDGVVKFNTKGKDTNTYCEFLGQLSSNTIIRVAYRKDGSGDTGNDNIVFYLQSGEYVEDIKNITYDPGYRYTGKQPENWIWFNNEMWRIIGSVPVCLNADCTNKKNLVKIIRAYSIGAYAYDAKSSGYTGAWGSNTLYSLLNTYYYASDATKMNGQSHAGCYGYYNSGYQSKPNCDYTEIGILSSSYYGKMVKNVYWNTGASAYNVTPSAAYATEMGTQTVSGYVGLMTASDWGYAASSSFHSKAMNSYTSSSNKATETSWIFNNGYEWTSIQDSSSTHLALFVFSYGYLSRTNVYEGCAVRPVVYLDSSVYIISGDGTEGNPYQIGM